MSYKLEKPYTQKEKSDFIVKYNHDKNLKIEEGKNAMFALEVWEKLIEDNVISKKEEYEQEQFNLAKENKQKEASNMAKTYLEGGEALFEIEEGKHIEATDGNIGKLSAYALGFITGQLKEDDVIYWNTKEDITIPLTKEKLTTALNGLGQVQAKVWNEKFPVYLAQIEACTTIKEVQNIKINYSIESEGE